MFGEYELLVWVVVGITGALLTSRFVILPFMKEIAKAGHKEKKVKQEENEELNVKNIAGLSGGAIAEEVQRWISGIDKGVQQAKGVLVQQEAATAHLAKEERDKILEPLKSKVRQGEFFLQHKEVLVTANRVLTAPLIGNIAKKVLGGFI